jgi:hypothetical protein
MKDENMGEESLTYKELAVLLGVSETTVKSYRKKFPGSLPVSSKGRPIRFKKDAADICLKIRDLFATGASVEEVQEHLARAFAWRKPKTQATGDKKFPADAGGQNGLNLSQSFAAALGNIAKNIIALNQSQAALLALLQKVETRVNVFDLKFQKFLTGDYGAAKSLAPESAFPVQAEARDRTYAQEIISKNWLQLPLLMRRGDGTYTTAGGEKFGRLSLQDVITRLDKAHPFPDNYILRWERDEYGDWAVFRRQNEHSAQPVREIRFTLHEITSAKGFRVLEIKNCMDNNAPRPVTFFADFLCSI